MSEVKENVNDSYLFIGMLIIIVGLSVFSIFQHYSIQDQEITINNKNKIIEKFDMYYTEKYKGEFKEQIVTGLYLGDFISVWVKDRSYSAIMETCSHEWAHSIGMVHAEGK